MRHACDAGSCTCPAHVSALAHQGRTCAEVLWHVYAAQTHRQWPANTLATQGLPRAAVLRQALAQEDPHA